MLYYNTTHTHGGRGLGLVVHIPSGYVAKINIPWQWPWPWSRKYLQGDSYKHNHARICHGHGHGHCHGHGMFMITITRKTSLGERSKCVAYTSPDSCMHTYIINKSHSQSRRSWHLHLHDKHKNDSPKYSMWIMCSRCTHTHRWRESATSASSWQTQKNSQDAIYVDYEMVSHTYTRGDRRQHLHLHGKYIEMVSIAIHDNVIATHTHTGGEGRRHYLVRTHQSEWGPPSRLFWLNILLCVPMFRALVSCELQ
jgi:hypothetical protein